MSKRIGQALVEKGLLSPAQLDSALQSQLILGGQLGTSLIEQGFIDEEALGRTLAEIFQVRYARPEMFEEIPSGILETVPRDIVHQRRVIPIGIEKRSLHLAVVNPRNLSNLSSATGYKILPYLAPEIRIVQAMEQYYGIPRPPRYIQLSRLTAKRKESESVPRTRVAERKLRVSAPMESVPAILEDLSCRMSLITTRAELGDAILDYSMQQMDRAILFDVTGNNAVVVNWRGIDLDAERMSAFSLPVTTDSVFSLLAEDTFYEGPPLPDLAFDTFYETLGLSTPRELLILPIYGDDRLEAVVYGDSGPQGRIERAAAYPLLLEKISLAMKLLALREQLSSTQPPR